MVPIKMSSQEQRSNLSTPLVGDAPSPKCMNGVGGDVAGSLVGTLKGSCTIQPGYSVAYGPDRLQMAPMPMDGNASGGGASCAHHQNHQSHANYHNHSHHHHYHNHQQQHHHQHQHHAHCREASTSSSGATGGGNMYTLEQGHHHYQQIDGEDERMHHGRMMLQKNQRNRLVTANGGHEYQQLALQAPHSRRAINSDESQANSVEGQGQSSNANDTTNSDSDYLSSSLNIGGPAMATGGGCCRHACRCGGSTNEQRNIAEAFRAGGSQDVTFRARKKWVNRWNRWFLPLTASLIVIINSFTLILA